MASICKQKCKADKKVKKQNYSLGTRTYCSVCERTFVKENNPGIYCKCCGVKLRHKARSHSKCKVRYYNLE